MTRPSSTAPYWRPTRIENILAMFLVFALGLTISLGFTAWGIKYAFLSPFVNGLANAFALGVVMFVIGLWIQQDDGYLNILGISLAVAAAAGLGASANAAAPDPARLLTNFSMEIFTKDALGTAAGLVLLWMVWRHIRE